MANIQVVVHTDSCLSWTGQSGGADSYWLGTAVSPWLADVTQLAALEPATTAIVKQLLAPWHWDQITWATGAGAPLPHPAAGGFDATAIIAQLDAIVGALVDAASPNLECPFRPGDPANSWPLLLTQLARGPAPMPQKLGLAVVSPTDPNAPAPPDPMARLAGSITIGGVVYPADGSATAVGPDTITILVDDPGAKAPGGPQPVPSSASPPIATLTGVKGLIDGRSRLVLSQLTTSRNWLADLQQRLGRALDPLPRLADLADALAAAPPAAWTLAQLQTSVTAAITANLTALGPQRSRGLELICTPPSPPLSAADKQDAQAFAAAWAQALALPLNLAPFADGWKSADAEALPGDQRALFGDPTSWGVALRRRFLGKEYRQAVAALLKATLPAAPQAQRWRDLATNWLANDSNLDTLITSLTPTAVSRDFYWAVVAAAQATPGADDPASLEVVSANAYADALRSVCALPADPGIVAAINGPPGHPEAGLARQQCVAALAGPSPSVADAGALGGVSLRIDQVFAAAPPSPRDDYHSHFDGWVLAARRSVSGLGRASAGADIAALAGGVTAWSDPFVATRGDLLAGGAVIGAGLLIGAPVTLSRAATGSDTRVRRAIVSYRGSYIHPNNDSPTNGPSSTPVLKLTFKDPSGAGTSPLAYGQIYQVRGAFLGLGGVAPAGWTQPDQPWLTGPGDPGVLAGTFRDRPLDADNTVVLAPKSSALMRTAPPGAPRLTATAADTDGGSLSAALTGPSDSKVRALWRELLPTLPEPVRARLASVPSCFLDPDPNPPDSVEFYLRPPALALGAATDDGDGSQVWRYWTQRDADRNDARASARLATLLGRKVSAFDEPAVVYAPWSDGQGAAPRPGGCVVTVLDLANGGAPVGAGLVVRFGAVDPVDPIKITVVSQNVAVPSLATGAAGVQRTLAVVLPAGSAYGLSFQTFVDRNFFPGGSDPRFDARVANQAAANPWDDIGPGIQLADGSAAVLFGEAIVVAECLPSGRHMPSPAEVWQSASLRQDGDQVVADFTPPSPQADPDSAKFKYVSQLRVVWQAWSWDGGPLEGAGVDTLFAGPQSEAPSPSAQAQRVPAFDAFERATMFELGLSGPDAVAFIDASAPYARMLSLDLPPSRGAGYMRMKVEATSRYKPLRAPYDPDGSDLIIGGSAAGANGVPSPWLGVALPLRRNAPLPTPKVLIAAPLFGPASPKDAPPAVLVAAGFAVMLDEPAYDTAKGGGLAERLVAEVLIETLEVRVTGGGQNAAGATAALAVGMDPALGSDADPYAPRMSGQPPPGTHRVALGDGAGNWTTQDGTKWGVEYWSPDTLAAPTFRLSAVLGETLEPSSAAPIIPFASCLFDALLDPINQLGPVPLKPGAMARVRLRYEADSAAVTGATPQARQAAADALASPWSAPIWVQIGPRMDYVDVFVAEPAQWDTQTGEVTLTLSTADGMQDEAARVIERWRAAPTRTAADPVGPIGRLQAICGLVVRDVGGREVARPKLMATAAIDAAGSKVVFTAKVADLGGRADLPLFLQLIETHDYRQDAMNPVTDLASAATAWLDAAAAANSSSTMSDAQGRIIGFGPRYRF